MTSPDAVERALAALRGGQETFTRAQVAFLMDLAFRAALDEPTEDQAAADLVYRAGYAAGVEAGEERVYAEINATLRHALGGPTAATMRDAVNTHIRALDQKNAREAWAQRAREARGHGLTLDDPTWPAVVIPGVSTEQPTRTGQTINPTTSRDLQRVA